MATLTNQLTASKAKGLKKPGRHADGNGLYLKVRKTGSKYWIFMSKKNGKRTEVGLGAFGDLSLHDARKKCEKLRVKVSDGESIRKTTSEIDQTKAPTFLYCIEKSLETRVRTH